VVIDPRPPHLDKPLHDAKKGPSEGEHEVDHNAIAIPRRLFRRLKYRHRIATTYSGQQRKHNKMNYNERFSFPPFGAFPRPGDIRRGHRAVREGLSNLVSDTESYFDVLKAAYEEFTTEERVSPQGTVIGTAMDQTWLMLGVLRGALSLCPAELLVRPNGDQG
jgi:hypothetical protein